MRGSFFYAAMNDSNGDGKADYSDDFDSSDEGRICKFILIFLYFLKYIQYKLYTI